MTLVMAVMLLWMLEMTAPILLVVFFFYDDE